MFEVSVCCLSVELNLRYVKVNLTDYARSRAEASLAAACPNQDLAWYSYCAAMWLPSA